MRKTGTGKLHQMREIFQINDYGYEDWKKSQQSSKNYGVYEFIIARSFSRRRKKVSFKQ